MKATVGSRLFPGRREEAAGTHQTLDIIIIALRTIMSRNYSLITSNILDTVVGFAIIIVLRGTSPFNVYKSSKIRTSCQRFQ